MSGFQLTLSGSSYIASMGNLSTSLNVLLAKNRARGNWKSILRTNKDGNKRKIRILIAIEATLLCIIRFGIYVNCFTPPCAVYQLQTCVSSTHVFL